MKRFFALAVAAAAVIATPALAGPGHWAGQGAGHGFGQGFGDGMMRHMDLNGDGSVSAAEAEALRQVWLLTMDANGDGAVSEDEMIARIRTRIEAQIKPHVAKHFARLDQNSDGQIDAAEFEQALVERFARREADRQAMPMHGERLGGMHHYRYGGGCEERHDGAPAE